MPTLTAPGRRRAVLLAGPALLVLLAALTLPAGLSAGQTAPFYNVDSNKWTCTQAYGSKGNPYRVRAIDVTTDANSIVYLNKGCTGWIDLTVVTASQDMVKLHDGAKDLHVTGSFSCAGRKEGVHQDGMQSTGGKNVTFSVLIDCPTINNGGLWISTGSENNALPTNVVCDRCTILPVGNNSIHVGTSDGSGAMNSTLFQGTGDASPPGCIRINNDEGKNGVPTNPVNVDNSCLPIPPKPVEGVQEAGGSGPPSH
jgi:hypothetical protein